MQQLMPKIIPKEANKSANLHRKNKTSASYSKLRGERERERPFQSAGTVSLVTMAPHSLEVVSTTLQNTSQQQMFTLSSKFKREINSPTIAYNDKPPKKKPNHSHPSPPFSHKPNQNRTQNITRVRLGAVGL